MNYVLHCITILMESLEWDEWNREHIKKHNVMVQEVEEVWKDYSLVTKSYSGRSMIFGKTRKGRLLTVVLSYFRQARPYVVSARDMSYKERKAYYEKID